MKTCFSEGKLMKQFGKPPLSKRTPLSTNAPIPEQFFHDPHLCPNFKKTRTTSPPCGGSYETLVSLANYCFLIAKFMISSLSKAVINMFK